MRKFRKPFTLLFSTILILSMALMATGCNNNKENAPANQKTTDTKEATPQNASPTEAKILGEGATTFNFTVVDKDGKESLFEIHTDKKTVGEALQELNLIEGEEGQYGLYVKKVNGITADYDKDGVYWAFYVGEEYASKGVDATEIAEGQTYSLKIEKS